MRIPALLPDTGYSHDADLSDRIRSLVQQSIQLIASMKKLQLEMDASVAEMKLHAKDRANPGPIQPEGEPSAPE